MMEIVKAEFDDGYEYLAQVVAMDIDNRLYSVQFMDDKVVLEFIEECRVKKLDVRLRTNEMIGKQFYDEG